jgi:hypothetical protein
LDVFEKFASNKVFGKSGNKIHQKKTSVFRDFFRIFCVFFRSKLKLCLYTEDTILSANLSNVVFLFRHGFPTGSKNRHSVGVFLFDSLDEKYVFAYQHDNINDRGMVKL